jgi:hypothetical protein
MSGSTNPPLAPEQPEDAELREAVDDILDSMTTDYSDMGFPKLKRYEALPRIMQLFHAQERKKVQEARIDELQRVAIEVELGKPRSKYVRQVYLRLSYLTNRLAYLRSTQPPAADNTKQGEGE